MSDRSIRTGFARLATAQYVISFEWPLGWVMVAMKQSYNGSRVHRKKVKGVESLAHALLRSVFGRSED
jgi:hypothetical protein